MPREILRPPRSFPRRRDRWGRDGQPHRRQSFAWLVAVAAGLLPVTGMPPLPRGLPPPGAPPASADPAIPVGPDPVARYQLNVSLRPASHLVEVDGSVELPAAAAARESLSFALSDVFHDLHATIEAPRECAGPVECATDTTPGEILYRIRPRHAIPAGAPLRLRFSYAGGERPRFVFYVGPEGCYVTGSWYPSLPGVRARGTLRITVPTGYAVAGPGVELAQARSGEGTRFELAVERPGALWFAVGRYVRVDRAGAVPVSIFALHSRDVLPYLDQTERVLGVLSREFGPFPYRRFSIVEIPSEQAAASGFGGAGVEGAILVPGTGLDAPFNLAYYGHEISHQWWGNLVTHTGSRGDQMLDEAMAQYGALQVVRVLEGEGAAAEFRRTGYPGYGDQSAHEYLLLAGAGLDRPLADLAPGFLGHELACSKGFLTLDLLAATIGRSRFRADLRRIAREHGDGSLTWGQFEETVTADADPSGHAFFAEWFDRPGAPDWKLSWRPRDGSLVGEIVQRPPVYHASGDLEVLGHAGAAPRRVTSRIGLVGERTPFELRVGFAVDSVRFDEAGEIPHWTPDLHAEADALAGYTRANLDRIQGQLDRSAREFEEALRAIPSPDRFGARFLVEYGWGRVLMRQSKWPEARTHLEAAVAAEPRVAAVLPWAWFQLANVSRKLGDEPSVRRAVAAAAAADSSAGGRTGATRAARALLPDSSKSR